MNQSKTECAVNNPVPYFHSMPVLWIERGSLLSGDSGSEQQENHPTSRAFQKAIHSEETKEEITGSITKRGKEDETMS